MKRWYAALGLFVSFIFLYLFLFNPNPGSFFSGQVSLLDALFGSPRIDGETIREATKYVRLGPAFISLVLLIFSLVLRSWRWQRMINQVGKLPLDKVLWSYSIGYLITDIIPLRIGELVRAMLVGQAAKISKVTVFSTVVVERIIDMAGLVVLFGIALAVYPFPDWLRIGGISLTLVVVVLLAICILLSRNQQQVTQWVSIRIEGRGKIVNRLGSLFNNLIDGLSFLRSAKSVFHIIWSSLFLWFLYVVITKFALETFSISAENFPSMGSGEWLASTVLTIMTTLGLAIPTAPGGIGTYHGAALITLSWFNVPEGMSVVFATSLHLFMTTTLNVMGVIGMVKLGLSMKKLIRDVKSEQNG